MDVRMLSLQKVRVTRRWRFVSVAHSEDLRNNSPSFSLQEELLGLDMSDDQAPWTCRRSGSWYDPRDPLMYVVGVLLTSRHGTRISQPVTVSQAAARRGLYMNAIGFLNSWQESGLSRACTATPGPNYPDVPRGR